ncbi:MAG TPA: hypothetical protein VIT43_13335 [Candidatus Dormibacteraeota bacterium]
MWPFSRKQPAPPPDGGPPLPQVRFDWKQLPAIQRTVANHPLTVQTASFAGGLATHADPRTVAEPLSHSVSLEAPPGVILDFVRPQTRDVGPELVGRSRASHQRPVQRVRSESAVPDVDEGQLPPMFDAVASRTEEPIRRLPAATEPRPPMPLMRVSSETEPTPLPSRFEAPAPVQQPVESAESVAAGTESAAEVPAYPRLTLGQARRLGLGAPIPRVPDTASSVQRSFELDAGTTVARAAVPQPAPTMEADSIADTPQFQPFALDYLITKKAPPPAPTPISRRPRITPGLTVSRSAAEEAGADTAAPPDVDSSEESVEPSAPASMASTASTPIQRESEAGEDDAVPALQRTPDSQAAQSGDSTIENEPPGVDADAEVPVQRSATADVASARPTVDAAASTILFSAPTTGETGEAAEAPAAELPALPLAARHGLAPLQRQSATLDEPANSDGETAPLVSVAPAIATLESRETTPAATVQTIDSELINRTPSPPAISAPLRPAVSAQSAQAISAPSLVTAAASTLPMHTPPSVMRTIDHGPTPVLQRSPDLGASTRPIAPASALPLASRSLLGLTTPPTLTLPPQALGMTSDPAQAGEGKSDPELPLPLAPVARLSEAAPAVQRISSAAPDQGQPSPFGGTIFGTPEGAFFGNVPAVIQRSAQQEWSVQTQAAEAPSVQAAGFAPVEAHAAAAGSADHTDLDALATKLYDRIRVKLRHELLIDRERAGLLTDLR